MIFNGIEIRHPRGDRAVGRGLRKQADLIQEAAKRVSAADCGELIDAASILRGMARKADELNGLFCVACDGRGFILSRRVSVYANDDGLIASEIDNRHCEYCRGTGKVVR